MGCIILKKIESVKIQVRIFSNTLGPILFISGLGCETFIMFLINVKKMTILEPGTWNQNNIRIGQRISEQI